MQPIIKWTGSKRSQVDRIIKYFPKHINNYYEPFIGGGSILYTLLHSDITVSGYYNVSDINKDLINLWQSIQNEPMWLHIFDKYKNHYDEFNSKDIQHRKNYFNVIRNKFNEYRLSADFLFLLRTAFNGLIRYTKDGRYNTSCHFSRTGIHPDTLFNIIEEWHKLLDKDNIIFDCIDYCNIIPTNKDDFVYLDPPYLNTKGMYYNN